MTRKPAREVRPRVEFLESILPLTGGMAAMGHPAAAAVSAMHQGPHLTLSGDLNGTWKSVKTLPDTGGKQLLDGSGILKNLGHPKASMTLHTTGFIANGHATATLKLTNTKGTINLALTGPTQPGFSEPPSSFSYVITGGSGKYAGATGKGTAGFVESGSTSGTFTLNFD